MRPHTFDTYCDKYESISLSRDDDGVLTVTLHEPGHPDQALEYGGRAIDWHSPHLEWSYCFQDIARDRDNEIVIVTAAGEKFIGHHRLANVVGHEGEVVTPTDEDGARYVGKVPPVDIDLWDTTLHNGAQLQMNILNIDCPVIGAVNGPALTHADLVVQSDIVICTPETVFADQAHFAAGTSCSPASASEPRMPSNSAWSTRSYRRSGSCRAHTSWPACCSSGRSWSGATPARSWCTR
jgi:hypothetical protein